MGIEYTPDGTPYLTDQSYLSDTPPYTQELAQHFDAGGGGGVSGIKDSKFNDLQPADPVVPVLPVGTFMPYMGHYWEPSEDGFSPPTLVVPVPNGWLLCDGREYDPDYFKDLFKVCPAWNSVQEISFRVPDMRGRTVFGCTFNLDPGLGQEDDYARPVKVMYPGEEWGDWRPHKHNHKGAGGRQLGGPVESTWHENTTLVAFSTEQFKTNQIYGEWAHHGRGQNLPPYTSAPGFIVYAGVPTVDENGDILPECGQGPERPYVTTRMMIEQRLAEAGIEEDEVKMLKEELEKIKKAEAE